MSELSQTADAVVKNDESEQTVDAFLKSTLVDRITSAAWEANYLATAFDDLERALDQIVDDDTPDAVREAVEDIVRSLDRANINSLEYDIEELETLVEDQD